MSEKVADKGPPRRLVQIAPIVRGLLAEPTSNQDIPYEPVIVRSLTNKKLLISPALQKTLRLRVIRRL
ncbi:MAG: hypothetical protein ACYS74_22380 [Planctomycetota bacterium]|jgi:hypothetical protein